MIKKSLALTDKRISFSPKNEYKLAVARGEAIFSDLRNFNWRNVIKDVRTFYFQLIMENQECYIPKIPHLFRQADC